MNINISIFNGNNNFHNILLFLVFMNKNQNIHDILHFNVCCEP